jgi:hypothetical protein
LKLRGVTFEIARYTTPFVLRAAYRSRGLDTCESTALRFALRADADRVHRIPSPRFVTTRDPPLVPGGTGGL